MWKTNTVAVVVPVYFPESGSIQVHLSRVTPVPPRWPIGFYRYGGKKLSRGNVPVWVGRMLQTGAETAVPSEKTEQILDAETYRRRHQN
uniref:Uncharacterized protein n=1 Tax=Amphimedon queenslandica TaxID=400682 RepID=A0A1X7T5G7_AMPQE